MSRKEITKEQALIMCVVELAKRNESLMRDRLKEIMNSTKRSVFIIE